MAHFLSKLLRKLGLATHREWAWSFWAANTDLLLASYHGEVVWSFCVSLCTYSLSFKLYFWPLNCARLVVRMHSSWCHSQHPVQDTILLCSACTCKVFQFCFSAVLCLQSCHWKGFISSSKHLSR